MHLEKYPHANVIDLGIGDTTEPLPTIVTTSMVDVSYEVFSLEMEEYMFEN